MIRIHIQIQKCGFVKSSNLKQEKQQQQCRLNFKSKPNKNLKWNEKKNKVEETKMENKNFHAI